MNHPVEINASLDNICEQISISTACEFKVQHLKAVADGCINSAVVLSNERSSYFVKLNSAQALPMFDAESESLRQLAATNTLRVPEPLCRGADENCAWLVLENLVALGTPVSPNWDQLGRALAAMHRHSHNFYGWHRNNAIGSTLQVNDPMTSWIDFLRENRIGFQLELATQNGFGSRLQSRGNILLKNIQHFFDDYRPEAALLHGDLWSGNMGFLRNGEPVIFDAAVYYGDRETDIAMSELFGGFHASFYRAYDSVWPLDRGYHSRKHLYNLYHLLNHLNLFGQAYLAQCDATLDRLLAEIKKAAH